MYADTKTSYFWAQATADSPSDVIHFSEHGYSSCGRLVVLRGGNGGITSAVANGIASPVAVTLGSIVVSSPFSGTPPWSAALFAVHGTLQSITVLMASVATPPNAVASGLWVDQFPGDDSFLNVFALTTYAPPEVEIAEVQVTVTYQNPGNYLYARDIKSWG